MIDGHTKLVGLIGWPVEHSLSPAMHNAAFDALGLNWRYVPLPVPSEQVEAAVRGLAALGFRGANVTVPHKQAVIPALDDIAPDAAEFGAVNTLVVGRWEDGAIVLSGHNTDVQGFVGELRQSEFEPEGKSAVVVGAGGSARAVVFGLLGARIGEIAVLNRTLERAQALVSSLSGSKIAPRRLSNPHSRSGSDDPDRAKLNLPSLEDKDATLRALPLTPETLIESARTADLLVNTTTVGMWPYVDGSIWPNSVPVPPHLTVFDLVYNPLETQLLRQARESGAHAVAGLEMLVRQGALAFDMWTDQAFAVDEIARLMRAACERAIQQ